MKTVTVRLPDEQVDALERAVADGAFASPSELVRLARHTREIRPAHA